MYDVCCIGHLTLDKVVTPKATINMAGGTSFYFSNAIHNLDIKYILVTSLAEREIDFVRSLRNIGIEVNAFPSAHTVYFENIYSDDLDHRTQRVLQTADPFTIDQIEKLDASIFHLGPLLANDIPFALIKTLAERGSVSLDVQGYLRNVKDQKVYAIDWQDKREGLKHVDILKANETEMEVLTGYKDICIGAKILSDWGVKEVVITRGSLGSVIYANDSFYEIPAYVPAIETDTTGCGDTYMAGYLYQRIKDTSIQEAGEFAAAMATLKIESSGPFTGTKADVLRLLFEKQNQH